MTRLLVLLVFLSVSSLVIAEEAPTFRGSGGAGVAKQALPTSWGENENIAWSIEVSGGAWSSPIVVGEKVFLTSAVSEEFKKPKGFGAGVQSMGSFYSSRPPQKPMSFDVICLELQGGKELWRTQVVAKTPKYKIHPSNSYATESPASDGNHVFVYFAGVGEVACLDMAGKVVWQRNLGAYKTGNDFGTGSSPTLHDGKLFVQCDNEQNSFVVALDAESGEEIWKQKREARTSWSSPVIWQNKVRTELIVCGSNGVVSYDPSSGKKNWHLRGTGGSFSATPASDQERIYFGQSGRTSRGPLVAVNTNASGDLDMDSAPEQGLAWTKRSAAPGMCSPVAVDGRVYVLSRGVLSCHESESGKELFKKRLNGASSATASLWASPTHVYALGESGDTNVIETGDDFKLASTNRLPGLYWSTPGVYGQTILIRDVDRLYCVQEN